jgi:hypothetical protein
MTTLTALKAEIADDLARSDLTTQIASAITAAITYYKTTRFWFNETRASTFLTVDGQSTYTSSDDADIPLWFSLDDVFLVDSSSEVHRLERVDPAEIEMWLTGATPSEGQPHSYAYFEKSFRLYPTPGAVYTIKPMGAIEKAAPATDGEASNVWMTDAYSLIRARAKSQLYRHVIRQLDKAQDMKQEEQEELVRLRATGSKRVRSGRILATQF